MLETIFCNGQNIREMIDRISSKFSGEELFDYEKWENSEYFPVPTIVEAAQALYSNHNVREITRHDANIDVTTETINNIISFSRQNSRKSICFVTGVPGAGKTLVGLNVAITHGKSTNNERATYLSSNGPLVQVLQEALLRDRVTQLKEEKKDAKDNKENEEIKRVNKRAVRGEIHFIEIIHKFRDQYVDNADEIPPEHVVIFDEAQRAWTLEKMSSFMKEKKSRPNYPYSEPESLIGIMDRLDSWATIICLVGGGQEINDGEAGIEEWFDSLKRSFRHWNIYVAPELNDSEYCHHSSWNEMIEGLNTTYDTNLHLRTSIRSFRTPDLSLFVKHLLDIDEESAKNDLQKITEAGYPIYITRDLKSAKKWVESVSKGNCRHGLIASSNGLRLKSEGIFVKNKKSVEQWFLGDKENILSSYFMEEVATEFDIQGLEIDYAIVAWDADLRFDNDKKTWSYYNFRGHKWNKVHQEIKQRYLLNAYRVLLTRSRQGMIIFIPKGFENDLTRKPKFYDETHDYLLRIGISKLENE